MIEFDAVSFVLGFCTASLLALIILGLRSTSQADGSARVRGHSRIDAADLPPGVRDEVLALLSRGRKIEAVKAVRDGTGWGLKRSKETVEALENESGRS